MKTLILLSAVALAFASCTKDVVVPDASSGYYYNDPYSDPYYSPYSDPNYDPYSDPNYDPSYDPNSSPDGLSGNSAKPGAHTVAPGNASTFNGGGQHSSPSGK